MQLGWGSKRLPSQSAQIATPPRLYPPLPPSPVDGHDGEQLLDGPGVDRGAEHCRAEGQVGWVRVGAGWIRACTAALPQVLSWLIDPWAGERRKQTH